MLFSNILLSSVAAAAVVNIPLKARQPDGVIHGTQKNGPAWYEAEIEVGTPPQKLTVIFDTGSDRLRVPGTNSTDCAQKKKCRSSFDVSKSSTWKYSEPGWGPWGGVGNWGLDTVSYVGATFTEHDVYVSTDTNGFDLGVFGQSGNEDPKVSFVQALVSSGKIPRAVYSLNAEKPINYEFKGSEGVVNNVYYGGFDRAKYEGPLTTMKTAYHGTYALPLRLSIDGEELDLPKGQRVVMDTGGRNSLYTNSTLKKLSEKYGGDGVFYDGSWQFACGTHPTLNYHFGETVIPVDLGPSILPSPTGKCYLAHVQIVAEDTKVLLAGPTMISRTLVIYDNERDEITIAKAKYTDESDIVELTGDIPGAVRAEAVYY